MKIPCVACKMTWLEKAACCGCPERMEWEREGRYLDSEEQDLTTPNYKCPACGFLGYIHINFPGNHEPKHCPLCGGKLTSFVPYD